MPPPADAALVEDPGQQGSAAPSQEAQEDSREALEQELALSSSDLRSHAWYHGCLCRQDAEALLTDDGDFLVRESASQPGDFALTCRWNSNNVHFMINKMRVHPDTIYENTHYFLEDEAFETIPHLITSYVGQNRAISVASGARIRRPVTRSRPLGSAAAHPAAGGERASWRRSLLTKHQRAASAEMVHQAGALGSCHGGSLPRLPPPHQPLYNQPGRLRAGAASPPPKPDRQQSNGEKADSGSGSSGEQRQTSDSVPPPPPSHTLRRPALLAPESAFEVEAFETLLLPLSENAPLDATALRGVTLELLEAPAPALAAHLAWWDLRLLEGDGSDLGLGVTSGIELLTLPQGSQLRVDLLERSEWMSAFVAASILSLEDDEERVKVIAKWIGVAVEAKTALGDLYGFAAIVEGLCMPQVQSLCVSWHQVRQQFTPLAVQFDAQLRPSLRALREVSCSEAPNTCLPHVTPLATLLEEPLQPAAEDPEHLQLLLLQLAAGRQMAADVERYRRNARTARAARPQDAAETRSDLFRTEFHLRLLLGSRAARAAQQQRRGPLLQRVEQVLQVLAERRSGAAT